MRCCLLLLMGAVVVLGVEVEQEKVEVEVDTRERAERADLPPPSRPQRRPGSGAGFSSFLSGLLGSVTQTANVAACPGKCIHALASLMCDTVLEEVQCPTSNMRCCVEKSGGGSPPNRDSSIPGLGLSMPPRPSGSPPRKDESEEKEATTENVEEETTKKKKRRKKKDRTTTTTTPATTTKKEAVSTTEETEDDDEDDEEDETSNTSMSPPSTSISQPLLMMAVYVLTLLNLSHHVQSPF